VGAWSDLRLLLLFSTDFLHVSDSWGYSGACPDEMRSPVLGCAMRPFTWAGGNWAYAVLQCAATAFAVVLLWSGALKRQHTGALFAAVIASGMGLFSGWVMADVWTLTGLISLFVIAADISTRRCGLLAFSCGTHFGKPPSARRACCAFAGCGIQSDCGVFGCRRWS
jgi:hypothetical protein